MKNEITSPETEGRVEFYALFQEFLFDAHRRMVDKHGLSEEEAAAIIEECLREPNNLLEEGVISQYLINGGVPSSDEKL